MRVRTNNEIKYRLFRQAWVNIEIGQTIVLCDQRRGVIINGRYDVNVGEENVWCWYVVGTNINPALGSFGDWVTTTEIQHVVLGGRANNG